MGHGALEAGGVAGREQLLGIGALSVAAQRLGQGQLHVQQAVVAAGLAFAAAGGRGAGLIEGGHRLPPWRYSM
jgi:hypothetical protein